MPAFARHGEYTLEIDGNIIKLVASGAVNRETIEVYVREVGSLVEAFAGAPFAMYSVYDQHVILTPEAEALLARSITERVEKGLCASALNLVNSDHRLIISAQIGGLYNKAGVPWCTVDSYEAAKPWLEARIAEAGFRGEKLARQE
ncbi:hypothetical protein [Nisaea denitrificans]|uniref:hypothetical protein n=1 Tax=Nisaea denitrificans TaxID=390877 RepID=UPI00048C957A|nr:hypothetical protein [Nisaea denitrificans]